MVLLLIDGHKQAEGCEAGEGPPLATEGREDRIWFHPSHAWSLGEASAARLRLAVKGDRPRTATGALRMKTFLAMWAVSPVGLLSSGILTHFVPTAAALVVGLFLWIAAAAALVRGLKA
jgi:hypothetical protein